VIKCEPLPIELGVYVTEQDADPPVPESVHGLVVKLPAPFVAHETVPVGLSVPLPATTVATQLMLPPMMRAGVPAPQLTVAVVELTPT
jgi:hypothetical protein